MAVYTPDSGKGMELYEACVSSVLRILREGRTSGGTAVGHQNKTRGKEDLEAKWLPSLSEFKRPCWKTRSVTTRRNRETKKRRERRKEGNRDATKKELRRHKKRQADHKKTTGSGIMFHFFHVLLLQQLHQLQPIVLILWHTKRFFQHQLQLQRQLCEGSN